MRVQQLAALAGLTVVVLLVNGCGGDDTDQTAEPTPTSASSTTAMPRSDRMEIELAQCHQAGFPTPVDNDAAAARLSDGQELYLDGEGQARFTLIAKDCQDIVVDGESSGPGHFNTAWVRITGPEETRTIGEEPGIAAGPTDYFHPVAFQTDNDAFADATAAFGVPMSRATSMAMDPAAPGPMAGSVQDAESGEGGGALSYEWTMDNTNPIPDGTSGVVHVLEGQDDEGRTLTYDIECLVDGGWFGNPTTITFEAGSALADLVGTGYSGIGPART